MTFKYNNASNILNKSIPIATITLVLLILPTAFLHEKTSRIIFYYSGYFSIVGLLISFKKIKLWFLSTEISHPFLGMGSVYLLWSIISHSQFQPNEKSELLFTPAKRMFLSAIIITYILSIIRERKIALVTIKKYACYSIYIAFGCATLFGIYQSIYSSERILLGINRATLTSYAYSALSLALLVILGNTISLRKYLFMTLTILLSLYIIFVTQTRAAMAIYPLLSLLIFIKTLHKDKKIKILYVLSIVFIMLLVSYFNISTIKSRYYEMISDVQSYQQGNDYTSLGARFSMWKMGTISFYHHPLGATQDTRNKFITDYLARENKKSSVTDFLSVHLHNEFIQYASLFGIIGALFLLYFYIKLIFFNGFKEIISNPISMMIISAFLYGLTDVLLTSVEFIVIISTLVLLCSIIMQNDNIHLSNND